MADGSEEPYGVESYRSRCRKDRTDRREGRRANRVDAVDSSPASLSSVDHQNHENDEAGVGNDLSSSTDRDAARRERRAEAPEVSEEPHGAESYRQKCRRDRTDRREGRRANCFDAVDPSSASLSSVDHKKHENDEAVVGNDLSSSTDREAAWRERRAERRKAKEEAEAKAADESPSVEGAAAAAEPEKETPKRSLKKVGKGENSGRKRQAKKNLREKRRSTGVVIMPNMDSEEDEDKKLKQNTQQNETVGDDGEEAMEDTTPKSGRGTNKRLEQKVEMASEMIENQVLLEKLEAANKEREKLEKANKELGLELDTLKSENLRLKDENSALLRVVRQFSTKAKPK